MAKNRMEDLFPVVERSQIIENRSIMENCWHYPQNSRFSESYQEFYPPDVWFIGKQQIFEHAIANEIRKAKDMVIICSFLLQYTEIIKATLEVSSIARIYVITASENRLKKINLSEEGWEEEKVKDHLELLQKLKKTCLIRTAPHFHAKYVLIDPKNVENRQGFLSTANLTQHALANNVEIGIKLNDAQIIDLFNVFCSVFWYESKHELLTRSQLKGIHITQINEIPENPQSQHIIVPGKSLDFKSTLINLISTIEGDIYLSAFSIEESNEVYDLLIQELEKSRKIFLFIRPREILMPTLSKLQQEGAEIIGHSFLHMKVLIIDKPEEKSGIIFTGNLTEQSFSESFDTGIFLNAIQKERIITVLKTWKLDYLLKFLGSKPINQLNKGKYQIWNPKEKIMTVQNQIEEDLGELEGETIDNYQNSKPPFDIPSNLRFSHRKIMFTWRNIPPKLPSNVILEEIKMDEKIPKKVRKSLDLVQIFKFGSKRYIKVTKNCDIKDIRDTANHFDAKIVI